jgi:hypothetical protein
MKLASDRRYFFVGFLALVSLAFLAILLPFYSALMWAVILAMLFAPMQRALMRRMPQRANTATFITLGAVIMMVIIPVIGLTMSLVSQGAQIYSRIRSGDLNFGAYLGKIIDAMPGWLHRMLDAQGLLDLPFIQQRLAQSSSEIGQFLASQAVNIGQNTVDVLASTGVLLYVLFFLLRDGGQLAAMFYRAIPLEDEPKNHLLGKFAAVVKATVKGNVAVAIVQGALGGIILWALGIQGVILWSVVMAFLSLLPAVGSGLIWGPIALYFLATGATWQGVVLLAYGVCVIGMVDNVLRPVLVGKNTKMPDYVVLVSTIGGMSLFGLNGFVIGPVIAALFMAAWDLYVAPDRDRDEDVHEALENGELPAQVALTVEDAPKEALLEARAQLARAKAEEAAEAAAEVEAEVKSAKARKDGEDAGKSADKPRASEEGDRA